MWEPGYKYIPMGRSSYPRFVAPKHAIPLFNSPISVLQCPLESIHPNPLIIWWLPVCFSSSVPFLLESVLNTALRGLPARVEVGSKFLVAHLSGAAALSDKADQLVDLLTAKFARSTTLFLGG